jgi:hypothetical protein
MFDIGVERLRVYGDGRGNKAVASQMLSVMEYARHLILWGVPSERLCFT